MALVTLAAFSAAAGVLILLVFKAISNQRALAATRGKLRAHLLAIRLFADDPRVILRSQGRLLVWTLRYTALLVPAFLVIAIPLYFAWDHLDAIWGRSPLQAGDVVVLTAGFRDNVAPAHLDVPDWISVDSPMIAAGAAHEACWRLRISRAGSGRVDVVVGTQRCSKTVEARSGLYYRMDREPVSGGPIQWLEVRYPHSDLGVLGISAAWPVWFLVISSLTALLLRNRLRVTL